MKNKFFLDIIELKKSVISMSEEEYKEFQKYALDQIRLIAKNNKIELSEVEEVAFLGLVIFGKKSSLEDSKKNEQLINKPIYDISSVLKNISEDGMRIANYDDRIKNNLECAITAVKQHYLAYFEIGDSLKLNEEIINAFYDGYLNQQTDDYDTTMADYYPNYLYLNTTPDEIIESIIRKKN